MTPTPMTLEQLQKMTPGPERIAAVHAYLALIDEKGRDARKIRDDDLRMLAKEHGPAKAARLAGVSLSTVKLAVGRPR